MQEFRWTPVASQCRFGTRTVLPLLYAVSLIMATRTLKHGATELTGWVPNIHESETRQIVCPEAENVTVEMNCLSTSDVPSYPPAKPLSG